MALVAWYKLDGNAKNNTGDSSLDGVATNVSWVEGKIGKAGSFNGTTSKIVGSNNSILNLSNTDFSISVWFFPLSNPGSNSRIIQKKETTSGDSLGWMVWLSGSNLAFSTHNFDGTAARTLGTYDFNLWNHFVITNTDGIWRIYKNGVKINELSASNIMGGSSKSLEIGNATLAGAPRPFDGLIDDVKIYNRALSDSEIGRLAGIQNRMLVAHWPLNGSGEDITGNGYNLWQSSPNITWPQGLFSNSVLTDSLDVREKLWFPTSTSGHFDQGPMTISVWAKRLSEDFHYILCRYVWRITFDSLRRVQFTVGRLDPGDGTKIQVNGGTISATSTTNLTTLNKWHHIVAQYYPGYPNNNGYIKLYLDGALVAQASLGNMQMGINYGPTQGLKFGSTSHGSWKPVAIQIDETRIYNYILTEDEIKKLSQPLILHYKFDDRTEEATENLITNTTFSTWTKIKNSGSDPTIILNYATSPNSKKEATYMYLPNDGEFPRIQFSWTPSAVREHTFTIWLKGLNLNSKVQIYMLRANPWSSAHLLQTINPIPLEWTKYTITFTPLDSTAHVIYIGSHDNAKNSELLMWGPQLEKKDHPTPFTPTSRSGAIVKDSSLAQNHGTVALATTPKWVSGDISYGAMKFDGSQKITFNNPLSQSNLEQEWTVFAWIYMTQHTGASQHLIKGWNNGLVLSTSSNRPLLYLNAGLDDYYTYGTELPLNKWVFITYVFRNSDGYRRIFLNGKNISLGGPNLTSTPFGFGTLEIGTDFNGEIDDLRIYAKALSDSEILQIYNQRSGQMRFNNSAESTINMTSGAGKIEIK